ncbi:MAG: helicase-exonuclease AddAB subunit AddA [Lachnospiraceae bacterium]|nr:helicase-exonuclease AddAB subunit AddA [Lachnospiraceae bacterium]
MAIRFTEDQQKVIDTRNKNVLVSAAAGSGKTAVLVERIVSLVCDEKNKIDIDELLVVTFTKAAAAEMRERICKRISEKLEENPSSEHLQKQYALVHRAMITTIDAFCLNVLKNHFREIDFDPDFRVMDEGERELLRRDVLSELLEEKYEEAEEKFLAASRFFSPEGSDLEFEAAIMNLQEYAESFAWPEKFLLERKKDHDDTFASITDVTTADGTISGNPIGVFFYKYVKGLTGGYISDYEKAIRLCDEDGGPAVYKNSFADEKMRIEEAAAGQTAIEIGEGLKRYTDNLGSLPRCSTKGKKGEEVLPSEIERRDGLKEEAKGLRDGVKASVNKLIDDFFTPGIREKAAVSDKCAPYMNELLDITIEFRRRFLEKKAEKKIVDFGDIEHFALDILIDENGDPTPAALEYREHFKEIMVDEYQDSNLVQDVLLDAIASKEPGKYDRFMVGDVKQSIYGFRQARPDLFLEKFSTYPVTDGCERIDLSKNFRSRPEVLDSVNEIFEKIMHVKTGSIEYDDAARLYAGASYPDGGNDFKTELVLIDSKLSEELNENGGRENKEGSDEAGDSVSSEEYREEEMESLVLANLVRKALDSKVTETVKTADGEIRRLRPARYGDIVILHRTPSKIADALGKIFEEEGIPISISQGGGYFSTPEIKSVMQLLRTINNPLSDISLFGTLISVFGGLGDGDVAEIKANNPGMGLWEAVKKDCPLFADKINRYRKYATYRSIRELLQVIFDEHDYLEYIAALPGGAKRRANGEMLLTYASNFEKTSYYGLYHFVRYIDQLEKYTTDNTSEADVLGESADVVRLMSIHKSKGLEFPITIIAGMGKNFNLMDTSAKIVRSNELGLGCGYVDLDKRIMLKSIRKDIISKKIQEDLISEEMRLLYVAMTRAKEKLIMAGRVKDAQKKLEKIETGFDEKLSYSKFISAKNYFDLVLPVAGGCGSISVSVMSGEDIESNRVSEQLSLEDHRIELKRSEEKADRDELSRIEERFSYKYPFEYLNKLYTKTTVSELKMAAMLDEDESAYEKFESRETEKYIPSFRREETGITGTVRGNSYHRVMEIMDFDRTLGKALGGRISSFDEFKKAVSEKKAEIENCLKEFLEEELKEHRISEECFEAVNLSKILWFMTSRLAFRMWKSAAEGKLFREQPFVLSIPANKVNSEFPESESVIIQGIIDAYFVEGDSVILLDYKTDAVKSCDELVKRYETQLDYYQQAIEKLTGLGVTERILYSFSLGEQVGC